MDSVWLIGAQLAQLVVVDETFKDGGVDVDSEKSSGDDSDADDEYGLLWEQTVVVPVVVLILGMEGEDNDNNGGTGSEFVEVKVCNIPLWLS